MVELTFVGWARVLRYLHEVFETSGSLWAVLALWEMAIQQMIANPGYKPDWLDSCGALW